MLNKKTLEQFQKELGSKSPTPGGGVVAAIAAGFSASLIEMVCNLTKEKSGYEKVQKGIVKIHKDVLEIKKRLNRLAEDDSAAFEKVMSAYKVAKDNPKRAEGIKKALKYAIEVPMEVRKLAQELEVLGYKAGKIGNRNTLSDAKTAVHLARAASKSALENVLMNKRSLAKLK